MTENKALLLDDVDCEVERRLTEEGFVVTCAPAMNAKQLAGAVKGFNFLAVRSASDVSCQVLESADELMLIGRAGTGMDNIDVAEATKRGIVVFNTAGENAESVAECVVAQITAALHKIHIGLVKMHQGAWVKKECKGSTLRGKRVGIIGMGYIGKWVARLLEPFGVDIVAFEINKATALPWIPLVSLNQLLATSDIVTPHIPLTEQTKGMFNAELLAKMKPGAILVNFNRGQLVDEAAVVQALESGQLSCYVADTFCQEPLPAGHPFLSLQQSGKEILTPHLAAQTKEAQEGIGKALIEQALDFFQKGRIPWGSVFPQIPFDCQTAARLIVFHPDSPGVAQEILLQAKPVNIAVTLTNRCQAGGTAYTVVDTDDNLNEEQIRRIRQLPSVLRAYTWNF